MKTVSIYTDGACSGNPGPGGFAAVVRFGAAVYGGHIKEVCGGEDETTNNRMELQAMIAGLEALREPCKVTVYSDSLYAIGTQTGCKVKANQDLVARLRAAAERHTVEWIHVRGHAGRMVEPFVVQEAADHLASDEAQRRRRALEAKPIPIRPRSPERNMLGDHRLERAGEAAATAGQTPLTGAAKTPAIIEGTDSLYPPALPADWSKKLWYTK